MHLSINLFFVLLSLNALPLKAKYISITNFSHSLNADKVDYLAFYLSHLTPALFESMTEGITSYEWTQLIENNDSQAWEIFNRTSNHVTIKCKYDYSVIYLSLLPRESSIPFLVSIIENQETTYVNTWKIKDDRVIKTNLIPKLHPNDFFNGTKKFSNPRKCINCVTYGVVGNRVTADFSIFCFPELEQDITYHYQFKWNGVGFETIRLKTEKD